MTVQTQQEPFGTTPAGESVSEFTLRNANGMEVRFLDYGGIVRTIAVPDRAGRFENVTLRYDSLAEYLRDVNYVGGLIGRYANHIAKGRFSLDGREYQLAVNNGVNHLHGGSRGFDRVLWRVEPFRDAEKVGALLSYTSPDGEEGYPGTLEATCRFTLTGDNELEVDFAATTDRPTLVSLTQHCYFNLAGASGRDMRDHDLTINASRFTPVDATLIPTGELRDVRGTPFDFLSCTRIGSRVGDDDEQLKFGNGYDHNFVLDRGNVGGLSPAARLEDPHSGRRLSIFTTEPGLQFSRATGWGAVSAAARPFTLNGAAWR